MAKTIGGILAGEVETARHVIERALAVDLLSMRTLALGALKQHGFKRSMLQCPDVAAILNAVCDWHGEGKVLRETCDELGIVGPAREAQLVDVLRCYAKAWLESAGCWGGTGPGQWDDARLADAIGMSMVHPDRDPDVNAVALVNMARATKGAA